MSVVGRSVSSASPRLRRNVLLGMIPAYGPNEIDGRVHEPAEQSLKGAEVIREALVLPRA